MLSNENKYVSLSKQNENNMIDSVKFKETDKMITFPNGKTKKVFYQETKKGVRYYYYSMPRMIQISAKDIN